MFFELWSKVLVEAQILFFMHFAMFFLYIFDKNNHNDSKTSTGK